VDSIITNLIAILVSGGPQAVIAVLVLFIVLLLLDRKRLNAELSKKDIKLDKIIEDYYKGNLTLSEALNSLKLVLYEIKAKF